MEASSSRRNVVKALLVGAGAVAGGAWLLRGSKRPEAPAAPAPEDPAKSVRLLLNRDGATCPSETSEQNAKELALASWLSFATLSAEGLVKLLDAVEELLDRVETRLHPLGIDFSDEPLEKTFQSDAAWFVPTWTAARTIARRCFVSGDRSLMVTVPAQAQAAAAGTFDVAARPPDPQLRLARLLAWPICFAERVRLKSSTSTPEAWEPLRRRTLDPKSSVALVIDEYTQDVAAGAMLTAETSTRIAEIRKRCTRFSKLDCDDCDLLRDLFRVVVADLPPRPALSWLELKPGEAWVVPRLATVLRPDALRRELDGFGDARVTG